MSRRDRSTALRWLRRVAVTAFLAAVAVLLWRHASRVAWGSVADALGEYTPASLALAAALALSSHLLYASFDLLARAYTAHGLGVVRTLAIGAVSYAFNVNLGALVGGVGFRYRLYSRSGLGAGTVARVYAFAVTTNWSGYVALLGVVLAFRLVVVPEQWRLGLAASQALGAALLAVTAGYLALCALSPRRSWQLRGHSIRLPGVRFAAAQIALSTVNWMLMAAIVHTLLPPGVDYPTVLGVLLLAAIAGAMAHVPAGLGVIEAVFLLMLSDRVPDHRLIAALLAYRAAYYLAPLALALGIYPALEITAPRRSDGSR